MPPVVIAAGIVGVATVGGAIMAKKASDRQAEAAEKAGEAAAHSTTEEIVHRTPVEGGAMTVAGYQLEAEFQNALKSSLQAGNEIGFNF